MKNQTNPCHVGRHVDFDTPRKITSCLFIYFINEQLMNMNINKYYNNFIKYS